MISCKIHKLKKDDGLMRKYQTHNQYIRLLKYIYLVGFNNLEFLRKYDI